MNSSVPPFVNCITKLIYIDLHLLGCCVANTALIIPNGSLVPSNLDRTSFLQVRLTAFARPSRVVKSVSSTSNTSMSSSLFLVALFFVFRGGVTSLALSTFVFFFFFSLGDTVALVALGFFSTWVFLVFSFLAFDAFIALGFSSTLTFLIVSFLTFGALTVDLALFFPFCLVTFLTLLDLVILLYNQACDSLYIYIECET